jgi:malate dehydrogenase (oxaloacetate-decarboxylating)(NADP+)
MVTEDDLAMGRIYPSLSRIREVSRVIAVEVARLAFDRGLAQRERPEDIAAAVHEAMYVPEYHSLV